ncbi:hypothetical protein HDU89_002809 [Geranomyces variabilis]|nr:hypothetical protein HDU89_002809 [Geranomyces variabilis]
MSSITGSESSDQVYLFGVVADADGRYQVFSLRVQPDLPLLRFRILLANHLGGIELQPDRLDIWRIDEDIHDDDKRLLYAREDPASQFRLTELPRAFQTVGSWIPSIDRKILHVLVRLPMNGSSASAPINRESFDALPPAYTQTRANAPYGDAGVSGKIPIGANEALRGGHNGIAPPAHNPSWSGLPVPPHRTGSLAAYTAISPQDTASNTASAIFPAHEFATYDSMMDKLTAESSATLTPAGDLSLTSRTNQRPDKAQLEERLPFFRRKRNIWSAGVLTVLLIGGISAGIVVSRSKSDQVAPSPSSSPSSTVSPATSAPSPVSAPNSTVPVVVARKDWVMLPGFDMTMGKNLAHSSISEQNRSSCGTTCGEASACVASVWNFGTCYLKATVEDFIINAGVYAFFERNTSYTGWQQTIGQSVLTSDFAWYNVSLVECGSTCVASQLCRGFEIFDPPTVANPACVLKLLRTGLSPKPGATFYAKP